MQPLFTHVMVDLETMSTESNAAILSIGAVKFNPHIPGEIYESFYVNVDLSSCINAGMHVSGSTVEWWMHPDRAEAREALRATEAVDIGAAITGFMQWFGPVSLPLWGNGATFDNVILANAFKRMGEMVPWKHYHDRCFRTMKSLFPVETIPEPNVGVPHQALYDATKQTLHLQEIYKRYMVPMEMPGA